MDFSAFVCYDYVVYKGWSWCSHMINISGHLREERKIPTRDLNKYIRDYVSKMKSYE